VGGCFTAMAAYPLVAFPAIEPGTAVAGYFSAPGDLVVQTVYKLPDTSFRAGTAAGRSLSNAPPADAELNGSRKQVAIVGPDRRIQIHRQRSSSRKRPLSAVTEGKRRQKSVMSGSRGFANQLGRADVEVADGGGPHVLHRSANGERTLGLTESPPARMGKK